MYVQLNHPERLKREKTWRPVMSQIPFVPNTLQTLAELCRLAIRYALGTRVPRKLELLHIPSTSSRESHNPLPRKILDFLLFNDIDITTVASSSNDSLIDQFEA